MIVIASDSSSVDIPESAQTSLDGFRAWVNSVDFPERGRCTFFRNGVFLDMSPEKARKHNAVKTEITRVLGNLVKERDLGNVYADGLWITNDRAELSNEPDATFISWESFEMGRIRLIPSRNEDDGIEMRGSPDWVLEVVSNSSQKKDTVWLPEAYHAASVKEFWLVDARGEFVDFTIYAWETGGFEVVEPGDDNWRRSEVFGCEARHVRERDRIGAWSYTLHTR